MSKQNNTIIYLPEGNDATIDRWQVVAAALRAAGITDLRPAPMPAQQFRPKHLRSASPSLICSAEI
jgi:hypothetical protein